MAMTHRAALIGALALAVAGCGRKLAPPVEYAATPPQLLTPDRVETRIGTLEFFDGLPSAETVEKAYDHLDFMRGVRAFLDTIPMASLYAVREGLRDVGAVDGAVGIYEDLMATYEPHRLRIEINFRPRGGISSHLVIDSDWAVRGGSDNLWQSQSKANLTEVI